MVILVGIIPVGPFRVACALTINETAVVNFRLRNLRWRRIAAFNAAVADPIGHPHFVAVPGDP